MVSHTSLKKSFLAALFAASPVALFGFTAGSIAGDVTLTQPLAAHNNMVFYEKYTNWDKAVHWTATAVAPEIANRAQIGYFLPAGAFDTQEEVEELLRSGGAVICIQPKDEDYYVVMDQELSYKYLGGTNLAELERKLGDKVDKVGLAMSSQYFAAAGWDGILERKNVVWDDLIAWKPMEISPYGEMAQTDPRVIDLIQKEILKKIGLSP